MNWSDQIDKLTRGKIIVEVHYNNIIHENMVLKQFTTWVTPSPESITNPVSKPVRKSRKCWDTKLKRDGNVVYKIGSKISINKEF